MGRVEGKILREEGERVESEGRKECGGSREEGGNGGRRVVRGRRVRSLEGRREVA